MRAPAFTLLELLVSIAVMAVLIGILLPALARARQRGGTLALQVNQRECASAVLQYTNDSEGVFPSYGVPRTMIAPLEWREQLVSTNWWGQVEYWGLFLTARGYDGWISMGPSARENVYDRIDCASCGQGRSAHLLMAGAFAEPDQFVDGAADESHLHDAQLVDAVTFPSHKGMLIPLRNPGALTSVTFCDGHVELISVSAMNPGVEADLPYAPLPVVQTRHGIRGRDR